jgi:hypothetical protein
MRGLILAIALGLQTIAAAAQTTPAQLRELAYAGDYQQIEILLAQAHRQSVEGAISYDDLRELSGALSVSHPVIIRTVGRWLATMPDSPYANSIRASQVNRASWSIRGEGSARQTPRDSLRIFSEMQHAAMHHAAHAYAAADDYIHASDMILTLQPTTKHYFRWHFLGIVANVMDKTPNIRSLKWAEFYTRRAWGGRGQSDIALFCEEHASKIGDPDYDFDVCMVHLTGKYVPRAVLAEGLARLGDRDHPSLQYLRAWYLTNRFDRPMTADEIQTIEDYLHGDGAADYEVAERYSFVHPHTPQMHRTLSSVVQAAKAKARAEIEHDPYNVDHIEVLLQRHPIFGSVDFVVRSDERRANDAILLTRLAVAKPFHPSSWLDAARVHTEYWNAETLSLPDAAMPFYQNAMFYSDHSAYVVDQVLFHHLDKFTAFVLKDATDMSGLRVTPDSAPELVCPLVRLDRLAGYQCRREGFGFNQCPDTRALFPYFNRLMLEVENTDLCIAERTASIADLRYDPVEVDLEILSKPLVWE